MILLICYLILWAFILSWISNMILHEELPIITSLILIVFAGAVLIIYTATAARGDPLLGLLTIPLGAAVLGFGLKAVTRGNVRKCLLIGVIFSGVYWLIMVLLAAGLNSARG